VAQSKTTETTSPNEAQIKEWFRMRYGDKFVPTKEQMAWVYESWRPMMTVGKANREKLGLPAPHMDKARIEAYKKGAILLSLEEMEFVENEFGDPLPITAETEAVFRSYFAQRKKLADEFDKFIVPVDNVSDLEWYIQGIVPKGAVVVIGGSPGAGKTCLMLQMAGCLMSGEDFIGRESQKCQVLVVENNEGQTLVKDKIHKQASLYPNLFDLDIYWGAIRVDIDSKKLLRLAIYKRPDVIFIDTFSDLHQLDENSAGEMGKVMDALRDVTTETGTTVICLHHYSRPFMSKEGQVITGHLRGSSSIEGECDFALGLERKAGETILVPVKVRAKFDPIKLDFNRDNLTYSESGRQTRGLTSATRKEFVRELKASGKVGKEIIGATVAKYNCSPRTVIRDLAELGT
jgi:archaellum biogenesis ATPase FlaH